MLFKIGLYGMLGIAAFAIVSFVVTLNINVWMKTNGEIGLVLFAILTSLTTLFVVFVVVGAIWHF